MLRALLVVAVIVAVLVAFGMAGNAYSGTWRPPGVPVEHGGGLQGTLNGLRVTVLGIVDRPEADSGTGSPTARVLLGDRGGPTATLHEKDWLCHPAWGCVVAWSITAPTAVQPLDDDGQPSFGGPQGSVTLVYAPPPWFWWLWWRSPRSPPGVAVGRRRPVT